jgi:hypothetical protein
MDAAMSAIAVKRQHRRLELETDLIASHVLAIGLPPAAQFSALPLPEKPADALLRGESRWPRTALTFWRSPA